MSYFLVVEITDFDLKKAEKAEQVALLKEQFTAIKTEEDAKKEELETNKKIMFEHREKLTKMIEACKALHEGFDEKRREVKAEKMKKIRELTDPDHAWGGGSDNSPSFSNPVSPVTNSAPAAATMPAEDDPFSDPFASAADSRGAEDAARSTQLPQSSRAFTRGGRPPCSAELAFFQKCLFPLFWQLFSRAEWRT